MAIEHLTSAIQLNPFDPLAFKMQANVHCAPVVHATAILGPAVDARNQGQIGILAKLPASE
jgi:hypothetical protein